jgi:hypothetical protein
MTKVRCRLEENLAFMESFTNELVLLVVEFKESFLKISHTAMNELRGLG